MTAGWKPVPRSCRFDDRPNRKDIVISQRTIARGGRAAFCALATADAQSPSSSARTISPVRDGLYQVRDGAQISLFLVTSEGIAVVDPLSRDTASWLRGELERRFPGQGVRYVLHTSHRVTRADGASLLGRGVTTIGHELFNRERARAARTMPKEYESVSSATETFRERRTITLGGQSVELISAPTPDGPDNVVVLFPGHRILFTGDLFRPRSLPERIDPEILDAAMRALEAVEGLSFDAVLTGEGETVTRSDVAAYREYLQELDNGVRSSFRAGNDLATTQDSLQLSPYQTWAGFETRRRANIADIYQALRRSESSLFVGAGFGFSSAGECEAFRPCSIGSAPVYGSLTGLRYAVGRIGVGAQLSFQQSHFAQYPQTFQGTSIVEQRDTFVEVPLTLGLGSPLGLSTSVEAGPTILISERGQTYFGRSIEFVEQRRVALAWSVGGSVRARVAGPIRIIAPIRLVYGGVEPSLTSKVRLMMGVAVQVGLTNGVR